jgi:hypothetical protein
MRFEIAVLVCVQKKGLKSVKIGLHNVCVLSLTCNRLVFNFFPCSTFCITWMSVLSVSVYCCPVWAFVFVAPSFQICVLLFCVVSLWPYSISIDLSLFLFRSVSCWVSIFQFMFQLTFPWNEYVLTWKYCKFDYKLRMFLGDFHSIYFWAKIHILCWENWGLLWGEICHYSFFNTDWVKAIVCSIKHDFVM